MKEVSTPAAEPAQTALAAVGVEILEATPESARARVPVSDRLKQPYGLVHGGIYATIAESLCCEATAASVEPDGKVAAGLANQTSFLRPITEGAIEAEARARHRGRTTWLWEVDFRDGAGRLCATTRVTLAILAGSAER